MVAFCCPRCQGEFQVSDSLFGQEAACPICRNRVMITPPPAANSEPTTIAVEPSTAAISTSDSTTVSCPECQTEFPVHPEQADKAVACPACLRRIDLGKPTEASEARHEVNPPPDGPSTASDDSDAFDVESSPADSDEQPDALAASVVPKGGDEAFVVQDRPRTIQVGDRVVEIHGRSREERSKLRFRKNVFMLLASAVVLIISLLYFAGVIGNRGGSGSPEQTPTDPAIEEASGNSIESIAE